jgi:hypothetical protein
MKNKKFFNMTVEDKIGFVWFLILIWAVTWVYNFKKLAFDDDWNLNDPISEFVHSVGVVVPAASLLTCWWDEEQTNSLK